jgi:hypothetical protein
MLENLKERLNGLNQRNPEHAELMEAALAVYRSTELTQEQRDSVMVMLNALNMTADLRMSGDRFAYMTSLKGTIDYRLLKNAVSNLER